MKEKSPIKPPTLIDRVGHPTPTHPDVVRRYELDRDRAIKELTAQGRLKSTDIDPDTNIKIG